MRRVASTRARRDEAVVLGDTPGGSRVHACAEGRLIDLVVIFVIESRPRVRGETKTHVARFLATSRAAGPSVNGLQRPGSGTSRGDRMLHASCNIYVQTDCHRRMNGRPCVRGPLPAMVHRPLCRIWSGDPFLLEYRFLCLRYVAIRGRKANCASDRCTRFFRCDPRATRGSSK